MDDQTYITTFKEPYLQETLSLLVNSFLQTNVMWKKMGIIQQDAQQMIRQKIEPALSLGWCELLINGSKVIGVVVALDLISYLEIPAKPSKIKMFQELQQAHWQLYQKCDFSSINKGDALYSVYGVIDPLETGKRLTLKFWWYLFIQAKTAGWKYLYAMASHESALKISLKLGAEVIADVEFNGSKIWMIRVDFSKSFPSYRQLKEKAKL